MIKEADWNVWVLDSYGSCGKADTPQALPWRLRSRPMESEHTVMEISLSLYKNATIFKRTALRILLNNNYLGVFYI